MITLIIYIIFSYLFVIALVLKSKTISNDFFTRFGNIMFAPISLPIILGELVAFLLDKIYE